MVRHSSQLPTHPSPDLLDNKSNITPTPLKAREKMSEEIANDRNIWLDRPLVFCGGHGAVRIYRSNSKRKRLLLLNCHTN